METDIVYHYTSLDALRSILGKELCLWATCYTDLNDPSEQIWSEKYILEAIKYITEYHNDSDQKLIDWFGKKSYILSLSKKADDRNMWRLYCNDGHGVCLMLDKNRIIEYCRQKMAKDYINNYCLVDDVEYSSPEGIIDAINIIKGKDNFNLGKEEDASRWMRIVPFIKNADFDLESEVRCAIIRENTSVTIPYDKITNGPGEYKINKNYKDVRYRMRGDRLVSYLEIKFPINVLKGIILGYEVNDKEVKMYIENVIKYSGSDYYKDLDIKNSNLFSSKTRDVYMKMIKKPKEQTSK